MAAGNWQLAAPDFTGGVFKIQEFKISKATNGGWQLATDVISSRVLRRFDSRFKNSRLAKQRMAASGWQLAAGGSAFHRGGIQYSRIQEFKISKATNDGWQLAAGGSAFHRGGIQYSRIQEFKISKATNDGCLWPDAKSKRPDLISVF